MILKKYDDYITEKLIFDMLLESKVVFSDKFLNVLNGIKDDKISNELLKINSTDVDVTQNYIDITDEKDSVTFTPDRKAQELLEDSVEYWKVIDSQKYLTHSSANDNLFSEIGYEKPSGEPWAPSVGEFGYITGEIVSKRSGKTFVIFQNDRDKKTVLNKDALVKTIFSEGIGTHKIWKTSRNNIKVGRLVRSILKSSNFDFNDRDIEIFVNKYKSTFDILNDIYKQFKIVKGNDIAYWYCNEDNDRYEEGDGTLNNSCMSNVDDEYFDIYCNNNEVSLVILFDDNGDLNKDVYSSDRIKGRALLWNAKLNDKDIMFMDRIYTTNDSDVELFKDFASKNGWWYKYKQNSNPDEEISNGSTTIDDKITVNLSNTGIWDSYPYMDTLCYYIRNSETLTNSDRSYDRQFQDTDGDWDSGTNDDDDDDY